MAESDRGVPSLYRKLLIGGVGVNLGLIAWGVARVPATLMERGVAAVVGPSGALIVLLISAFRLPRIEAGADRRRAQITLGFGAVISLLWTVQILIENLNPLTGHQNMILALSTYAILFSLHMAAGALGAEAAGKINEGVRISVRAGLLGALTAGGAAILANLIFMQQFRKNPLLLEDFARSGMANLDAFLLQDTYGGVFFHIVLLGLIIGAFWGGIGAGVAAVVRIALGKKAGPTASTALLIAVALTAGQAARGADAPKLPLESIPSARFEFGGPLGERINANRENWLLPAPGANPGMIDMFAQRDRKPEPNLVPWAGEFVGKYLISAIQALRMTDDPKLEATVKDVIARLIAQQAEDGYLGPFPQRTRLTANWDLWGHYHVIQALLMWHERTGDAKALEAAKKAADLACKIYLDSGKRMLSAGSDEMNLAFIHGLGQLYRRTGEKRYLAQLKEIEKDWESAGDYFRSGRDGIDFYRSPRPRWESLHDLQGLVELYRITRNEDYKRAFMNHWQSIRRFDRRNTGGFSSGEQATGHPYTPSAIETCSTTAWMAISVDALKLTGDPAIADEIELSLYNSVAGSQHPSGRWFTYNTPMDGIREASAHTIVFQARAGTPELNCCSVNGPRGLGMMSEWGVMKTEGGLAVEYLGPMNVKVKLEAGTEVALEQVTEYPRDGEIKAILKVADARAFKLGYRIPAWSRALEATAAGEKAEITGDGYARWNRTWKSGDEIRLRLELPVRVEAGDEEALGMASVYRGPILLAYDQRWNEFDEQDIPPIDPGALKELEIPKGKSGQADKTAAEALPWLLADFSLGGGRTLRLCDYASAGATGTRYRSWLPMNDPPPPPPVAREPHEGATVPKGRMLFTWRKPPESEMQSRRHYVEIREAEKLEGPVVRFGPFAGERAIIDAKEATALHAGVQYIWTLEAENDHGKTRAIGKGLRFRVDALLPLLTEADFSEFGEGPEGILVRDALAGKAAPEFGKMMKAEGVKAAPGREGAENGAVEFDGKSGRAFYGLKAFPEREYSVSLWVWVNPQQGGKFGQVFSAWAKGGDDPLRLCVTGGKLFARMEAAGAHSTAGVEIKPGEWVHAAAVKKGDRLTLFVNGKAEEGVGVPAEVISSAGDFSIGGNPHFTGDEYLAGRVAGLEFFARALSEEEIRTKSAIHR